MLVLVETSRERVVSFPVFRILKVGSILLITIPQDCIKTFEIKFVFTDKINPVIQWEYTYNGWKMFHCEVESLLDQVAHGSGKKKLLENHPSTLLFVIF